MCSIKLLSIVYQCASIMRVIPCMSSMLVLQDVGREFAASASAARPVINASCPHRCHTPRSPSRPDNNVHRHHGITYLLRLIISSSRVLRSTHITSSCIHITHLISSHINWTELNKTTQPVQFNLVQFTSDEMRSDEMRLVSAMWTLLGKACQIMREGVTLFTLHWLSAVSTQKTHMHVPINLNSCIHSNNTA